MAVPIALLGAGALTFVGDGLRRAVDHPALPHGAGGRAVRARRLRGARLHDARAGPAARALAGGGRRRARRSAWRSSRSRRRASSGCATSCASSARRTRELRTLLDDRRGARRPALRRADVPDLPPRARRALDARRAGRAACARAPRTRGRGAVAVYIAGDEKFERRFGRADGVSRATNELPRRRARPAVRARSSCSSRAAADAGSGDTARMPDRNVLGRPARVLRHRPPDRLLPRRLLQHRARGPRQPHDLRRRDRGVPRAPARDRQRPLDADAAVRLPRPRARRPLVRHRGELAARAPRRRGRLRRARLDARARARQSSRSRRCASTPSTSPSDLGSLDT